MIERVIYGVNKFEYPVFEYLYSYLVRFAIEKKIDIWTDNSLRIDQDQLKELKALVEFIAKELLDGFYEKPSNKRMSKYSSRYRKININGAIYIVDYRLDPIGKIVYSISTLLDWIDECLKY